MELPFEYDKMQHQKMNDVGMHPIFVVPGLSPSLLCWNMSSVFSLFLST